MAQVPKSGGSAADGGPVSAKDLRKHMAEVESRKASEALAKAKARTEEEEEFKKKFLKADVTENDRNRIRQRVLGAAERGDSEFMSYADTPLEGRVESIGWGISQADGSTGSELLPEISPTFEWIRLAQRVPVRVQLTELPEDVKLRVGTTASVLVMTGTAEADSQDAVPAAPKALQ